MPKHEHGFEQPLHAALTSHLASPSNGEYLSPTRDELLFGYPMRALRPAQIPLREPADPAGVLVDVVASLLRPSSPALVEFSGGVDSSLVLSAATAAARRAGWPDPVPVTYRFPSAPTTDETAFQDLMIRTLKLRQWRIFDLDSEHDVVGPDALELLTQIGPILPGVLAGKAWSLKQLGGQLMLNGEGGDAVFGTRRVTSSLRFARHVRHGEIRQACRLLPALTTDLSAGPLRSRRLARSLVDDYGPPWLTERVRRDLARTSILDEAAEPLAPRRFVEYEMSRPGVWVLQHNARQVRRHFGVDLQSPLLETEFLAALAASVPWHRWIGRTEIVSRYFADLLPPEIAGRRTKAEFSAAYFARHTRQFAERWDGTGLPVEVDAGWLKHHWASADPVHGGSCLLLQHAALSAERGERS